MDVVTRPIHLTIFPVDSDRALLFRYALQHLVCEVGCSVDHFLLFAASRDAMTRAQLRAENLAQLLVPLAVGFRVRQVFAQAFDLGKASKGKKRRRKRLGQLAFTPPSPPLPVPSA